MLKVVHDEAQPNEASGSVLDEIVREAARQMLAVALEAEVSAYIDAHAEEVDENGHRLVVRNGHHNEREVITAAGSVPVRDFGKLKWPRFGILRWPRCLGCGVGRHLDLAHSPVAAKCGTLIWPHLVWVFLLAA
jgi:Transposase, Mutator family